MPTNGDCVDEGEQDIVRVSLACISCVVGTDIYRNFAAQCEGIVCEDMNAWVSINSRTGEQNVQVVVTLLRMFCLLVATILPEIEQLRQAVQAASTLQEIVGHQLGSAGS
jgi:hypothetical protein